MPACRSFSEGRNGRMYDPVVARFLSPDPIIQAPENTQSYNSYSYVMNNSLRFTDPSGFVALDNCDWFVNSKTGDVYYNTEYRKGDEEKIDGEGWEHFAENGKLNASGEESVDLNVLLKNQHLIDDIEVRKWGKMNSKSGQAVSSFGVEATFIGKNAEELMSRQGYKFVLLKYKYHSDVTTEYHPEPHGQVTIPHDNSSVEEKLLSGYASKDFVLRNTQIIGNYRNPVSPEKKSYGPMYSIRLQSLTVRKDSYGLPPTGLKVSKAVTWFQKTLPWKTTYEEFWKKVLK